MPRYSRVVILGASGIIGQHMVLSKPSPVEHLFALRRQAGEHWSQFDLESEPIEALGVYSPDVVVNLAGESRVDVVEGDPGRYRPVNVGVPDRLASWCDEVGAHLIHVSTQAVFSGDAPPYHPYDIPNPVNEYGKQKADAEMLVSRNYRWTIARPTFVLGIRPVETGRVNPIEDILARAGQDQAHVDDRFFSVSFAKNVAEQLWYLVAQQRRKAIVHIGLPQRWSRAEIARAALKIYRPGTEDKVQAVPSDMFTGLAPRPRDTSYAIDSLYGSSFHDELEVAVRNYRSFREAR